MPDDWDTPGTSQQPLPGQTTHVGHVSVVDRKTKDPEDTDDISKGDGTTWMTWIRTFL